MTAYNLFSQIMSYFCRYSTCFIVFIPRPVTTSFDRFFAVLVHNSCILKLSGTGPVRGPSKKGNRTKTELDSKALNNMVFERPLWSWCRRSGVIQEKILQCGKSFHNGSMRQRLWLLNSYDTPSALSESASRVDSGSCSKEWTQYSPLFSGLTRHVGHEFSLQQTTKHCSG